MLPYGFRTEPAAIHGVLQPEVEAGQYVRPSFSPLAAITCACECLYICAFLKRHDVTRRHGDCIERRADGSLPSGSAYGNGNDSVVLTNETAARNEATARAYLGVPVARLAERSQ